MDMAATTGDMETMSEPSIQDGRSEADQPLATTGADGQAWREHIAGADMEAAIKVLQTLQDMPDLKACAAKPGGEQMCRLLILGNSVLAPSKQERRARTRAKQRAKASQDQQLLQATAIRTHRKVTTDYLMVALTPGPETMMLEAPADDESVEGTEAKESTQQGTESGAAASEEGGGLGQLHYARRCCTCGNKFRDVHHFYDKMCTACAQLNWKKRHQCTSLEGRVALVTGGRVKIGFMVVLTLLRSGAYVHVTTRFPHDSALRYAAEPDYNQWKHRLKIYGLDFRSIPNVQRFCSFLMASCDWLDIIIGNAAQTVRRPPSYYRHLLDTEARVLPPSLAPLVDGAMEKVALMPLAGAQQSAIMGLSIATALAATEDSSGENDTRTRTMAHSALLSQVPVGDTDHHNSSQLFPPGVLDKDKQQVDLRPHNSWTETMDEVSPVELVECHAINVFAPFVINSMLKPLLEKSPHPDRYVVNVSAMEGQFYRKNKTPYHPHTNMAKASLNMMTRTAAAHYAKSGIYMTCVDTGWITDENPVCRHGSRAMDPPPLDELDGAMRILDPVLTGIKDPSARVYGVFLKDYRPTRW